MINLLIAQVIYNTSEQFSLSVQGAWEDVWDLAFNGPLFLSINNLALAIAVASLVLWTIQFTKTLLDDNSYRDLSDIIWPIIVILLLANGGRNLIDLTKSMRGIINNANNQVLAVTASSTQLTKTLSSLSDFGATQDQISLFRQQCNGITKNQDLQACLIEANTKSKAVLDQYSSNYALVAPAYVSRIQKQVEAALQNPLEIPGALINLLPQVTIAKSIAVAAIEVFMVAMQTAFQSLVEVSFLLTGLLGPIAVGASLLPFGAKPIYAWLTAFWSAGLVKLCLNIITGLSAASIASAGQLDSLAIAIVLGLLSPILAFALASGGGIAIFNAILAAASAATSVVARFV